MSLSKKLPVAVICPVASIGSRCGASICCIFTLPRSNPVFSASAVSMMVQTSPGGPPQTLPSMSFGVRTLPYSTAEYTAHISWFR